MKKKLLAALMTLAIVLTVIAPLTVQAAPTGWNKIDGKYKYYYSASSYYTDTIECINDEYYAFDEDGWMQVGWFTRYSDWYYAKSSGALASGWEKVNGKWYYFEPDSFYMHSNELFWDGYHDYYLSESGAMLTGWIKCTYSFDDGVSLTDWLYADSSGVIQKKWKKINGVWYYFDDYFGNMYTGSKEINGKWYVFRDNGAWVSSQGWVKVTYDNGYWDWFYTDSTGTPKFGWQKIGGIWYYFYDFDASMVYSTTYEYNGYLYAFDQNGALLYGNGWKKLIQWDGTVIWVYLVNNYAKTGWLDGGNGIWYYLHPEYGYMEDAGCKTGDYLSLFYPNGVWQGYYKTPGWKKAGVDWYYINADGTLKTGWLTLSGKKYYLDPDYGYMLANGWYTIGETEYEFDESGALVQ